MTSFITRIEAAKVYVPYAEKHKIQIGSWEEYICARRVETWAENNKISFDVSKNPDIAKMVKYLYAHPDMPTHDAYDALQRKEASPQLQRPPTHNGLKPRHVKASNVRYVINHSEKDDTPLKKKNNLPVEQQRVLTKQEQIDEVDHGKRLQRLQEHPMCSEKEEAQGPPSGETTPQAQSPVAASRAESPVAASRAESPVAASRAESPVAAFQAQSLLAALLSFERVPREAPSIDDVIQAQSVHQAQSPMAASRADSQVAASQAQSPMAASRADSQVAASQAQSPMAASQAEPANAVPVHQKSKLQALKDLAGSFFTAIAFCMTAFFKKSVEEIEGVINTG